jgi:hypothetical protein
MSARMHAGARPQKSDARPVSKPVDRHEREAERAADVVARGGSVSNWSFSAVPTSAPDPVQRQQVFIEKTDEQKKQEATSQTIEAVKETPEAKALKDKVMADPVVKAVKEAVTSTPGKLAAGAAVAGGVGALAAAGKPLPVQPPKIPIKPGVSAELKYEGPVNAPTYVGVTVTLQEQAAKARKTPPTDPIAADIARLKAQQEMFKPDEQKAAEKKQQDELVQAWIASKSGLAGLPSATIPLKGEPKGEVKPKEEKKEEEKPPAQLQRQRAGGDATAASVPAEGASAPPIVSEVLHSSGQSVSSDVRAQMEARFGQSFDGVRIHTDPKAASSAAAVGALAYTVGSHIVFGDQQYAPGTDAGRRLLAHELVHVVQQADGTMASIPRIAAGAGSLEREAESVTSSGEDASRYRSIRARAGATFLLRQKRPKSPAPDEPRLLKPPLEAKDKPSPEERKDLEAEERRLSDEVRKGGPPPRELEQLGRGAAPSPEEKVKELEEGAKEARRLRGIQRDADELNRKLESDDDLSENELLKLRGAEMQLDLGPELIIRLPPGVPRPHTVEGWERLAKELDHKRAVIRLKIVRAKLGKQPQKAQPQPPPPKPKTPPPPPPRPPAADPKLIS